MYLNLKKLKYHQFFLSLRIKIFFYFYNTTRELKWQTKNKRKSQSQSPNELIQSQTDWYKIQKKWTEIENNNISWWSPTGDPMTTNQKWCIFHQSECLTRNLEDEEIYIPPKQSLLRFKNNKREKDDILTFKLFCKFSYT